MALTRIPAWASIVAGITFVVWAVVRVASVWGALGQHGVNPWIFLTIDIATVPPYTWGLATIINALLSREDVVRKLGLGILAAVFGFAAPYVYLYAAGYETIPLATKIAVAIIILAIFIAFPMRKIYQSVFGKARSE